MAKSSMEVTDLAGSTVTINLDRVCAVHDLPHGSKIVFGVDYSIECQETQALIRSHMEGKND